MVREIRFWYYCCMVGFFSWAKNWCDRKQQEYFRKECAAFVEGRESHVIAS